MNDLPIFTPMIASKLIDQGFKIKNIVPDFRNPARRVYYFERTPAVEEAFRKIATEWKERQRYD